jgi:hypothetical protein
VGPTCRCQFPSPVRSLSLSLSVSRAQFASAEPLPPHVLFSLSVSWACLVSSAFFALAVDRRVRTHARRRVSRPRRPPTHPTPFLEPASAPHSPLASFPTPSPSLVLCPCRQTPSETRARVPTIQLAEDRAKPPRAPPRGETLILVPNFPYCALCLSNFTFAGARPRRSVVLARWLVDLARSSSPE